MDGGLNNIDGINGPTVPQNPASSVRGLTKDTVLLSWQSTKEVQKKDLKWYSLVGFVILFPVIYSIWVQDWFVLIIITIILPVIFFHQKNRGIINASYKITPLGIYENEKFYPFSEVHSFWIVFNQRVKTLNVVFMKKYLPQLSIDISNIDPLKIRAALSKKIPEQEKRGEGLIDYLIRIFDL